MLLTRTGHEILWSEKKILAQSRRGHTDGHQRFDTPVTQSIKAKKENEEEHLFHTFALNCS